MSSNIFQDPTSGDWYSGPPSDTGQFNGDEEEQLRSRGIVRDPYSGEFYQVPQSSIPHWRKPEPIMAPQAPQEPTVEDGVGLADYARSVMAGGAQIGQAAGWLLKQAGAEDIGGAIETLGKDAVDYWNEGLSDAAKDAISREFVRKNEAGDWEWGDANLHTVGLFGAQSLLGTMAGAGAGAGITKVLQTFANPVGRSALLQAAQAGTRAEAALAGGETSATVVQAAERGRQAMKKLALVDKVIGSAGFAAGEGIVGGASAGVNVYDRVMTMDPAKIAENPRYRQVYESTDDSMPELERHQYAAETVAREASTLAGLQSGLTTALLGAPMGAFFGSLFGRSAISKLAQSRAARAATGAGGEAAQEFAQGAAEQAISNVQVRDAGDTDVGVWDDVLNQALGGALAGAPAGGVLGTFEAEHPEPNLPSIEELQQRVKPPQETLALPAPRTEADFTVGANGEAIPRGQTRPEPLALPPPGGNADFTVTSEGETIPRGEQRTTPPDPMQQWARDARATTAEIRTAQAARAQQEAETLGQSPASKWTPDTIERVKAVATEAVQAGADREAVLEVVRAAGEGRIPPLVAQRRMRQLQSEVGQRQALPSPRPASAFEVSPTGEARQLTEAEARQANERVAAAAQAKVDIGTAPTKAPGLGGKREQVVQAGWKSDTMKRVRAVADSAVEAGVPREVADGVLARMAKGEVKPLVATRQLKQLQAAQSATTQTPQAGAPKQAAEVSRETPAAEDQGIPATEGTVRPLFSRGGVNEPGMRDLLAPVGQSKSVGAERGRMVPDGISRLTSDAGSTRYVYSKEGKPQAVLQVMSRDGKRGVATNAFTEPGARRQGLASQLLERARKDFDSVELSSDRSDDGEAFAKAVEKPRPPRGKQTEQRLGLLPRDMREELFGIHANFNDPDAKQADFNLKKVPRRPLRIDNIEGLMDIPDEQLERYKDPRKLPPVVIADGRLIDGQHRIARAKQQGVTELDAIDMTGLINTDEAGYITELPEGTTPKREKQVEPAQRREYSDQRNEANQATAPATSAGAATQGTPGDRFARITEGLRSHRARNGAASGSYSRRSGSDGGSGRVLGSPTRAEFTPSAGLRGTLESIGAAAPTLHELTPEGAQLFADSLSVSKQGNKFGAAVYVYPVEEYRQMRLFLAEDGKAGFALKGDDIVSVFALAPHKGAAAGMLELAVQEGGRRLDAFDTILPSIYAASGFRTVARIRWNDDYAPEGWNKGTFGAFNGGQPDVVFMVYDPANAAPPTSNDGQVVEDYDAAVALQKEGVAGSAALRRQGVRPTRVNTAGTVHEELKDFIAGISPLVGVHIWESAQELQVATGIQVPASQSGPVKSKVKGVWEPGTNAVHLIAENIEPGEAIQIATHEVFGHLAIERIPEGERAIQSVRKQIEQGAAWTKPYVDEIASLYGNISSDEMAREVIAHMAEKGEKNLTMSKLMAAFRRFLRKLGVKVEYSDSDIRDLIARSARALKQEAIKARPKLAMLTPAATDQQILDAIEEQFPSNVVALDAYMALRAARDQATGDVAAALDAEIARMEGKPAAGDTTLHLKKPLRSAGEPTIELDRVRYPIRDSAGNTLAETPEQQRNFWRWFRGSKAVNKAGKPVRAFHGTPHDFEAFDTRRQRDPENKSRAWLGELGSWFAAPSKSGMSYDEGNAEWMASEFSGATEYDKNPKAGGKVMPVYLAIKNPAEYESWEHLREAVQEAGSAAELRATLEAAGHDGIAIRDSNTDGNVYRDDWIAFEPTQIKSAIGNRGTFDPSNPSILFRRGAAAADPKVQSILDRVMVKPPEAMTMRDRARELWQKITGTSALELKQGFIDSFASIEALERDANNGALRDAADSAYKAALATKNLSSVMAGVMLKGVPEFRNGAYQPVAGRRGIIDIFNPLTQHRDGNLLSQWEGYAAARRASRLIKEKNIDGSSRENLFTQDEIDTLLTLEQRYPEFARVFDEWQTFNRQVLDLAQEAGIVDPETRVLWERNDYVPFYRVAEELGDKSKGPGTGGGLANQRSGIRQLKGGEAQLGNVFENMMMNTAHLIDASFKNRAMQRIVELGTGTAMEKVDLDWEAVKFNDAQLAGALRKAGIEVDSMNKAQREHWSTLFRRIAPKGPNIASVMVNGKPEYYEVTDPLVLQSIAGLGYDNFADVFGLFRGSKKLLTNAITADPAFMMANFVRDTLSNWVISDASTKPLVDAVKALRATLTDDPDLVQLMMAGAGGGGFYDSAPEDIRKLIADRVPANQQRAFLDSVVGPKNVWRVWRKVGAAAENANRIATFRAVLAAGGSVAEAAYQARDVLNFGMAGNFGAMRWLTQSVPFLNARVQGLYRLYRGARDNKRAFFTKGLMLTAATMALALTNEDDDRYEELPEWDKDTYWHLFLGDEHYRIPKPFEVGGLFSTIPERVYRAAAGRDSASILADRMYQMFSDTFAFNPVPQLVKPIIEQYANRSMFTGSPIVGMAEQPLQPEAQFTPWTSETMQELAKAMPDFAPAWLRSPKRLEAALRAYTGAIGMYILGVSDQVVRTAMGYPPEPGRKIYDLPIVSRFWKDPDPRHTKYADELYKMMDEANAVSSTVNRYTRERRFEEAAELRSANKDKLAVRVRLNRLGEQVRNINNQIRLIQLDERMDPATKRDRIDALVDRKNATTREVARYADIF